MVFDPKFKLFISKNASHCTECVAFCFYTSPIRKEHYLEYVVLTFVSVGLLLAVIAFIKERRLRLALQGILRHLIHSWRANGKTDSTNHTDTDNADRSRL